jgi:hypothetical protein
MWTVDALRDHDVLCTIITCSWDICLVSDNSRERAFRQFAIETRVQVQILDG